MMCEKLPMFPKVVMRALRKAQLCESHSARIRLNARISDAELQAMRDAIGVFDEPTERKKAAAQPEDRDGGVACGKLWQARFSVPDRMLDCSRLLPGQASRVQRTRTAWAVFGLGDRTRWRMNRLPGRAWCSIR